MERIYENVALAKSILSKKNIDKDNPLYEDYLKIREICGNNAGYVGILTRLRFIDQIIDFDELKSIYEVLLNSKMDVSKISKLSYQDILDTFYDELIGKDLKKDYELIYKDDTYLFYEVHTYEGIMEIGSPAWCLKTKSRWIEYKEKYGTQIVVIHKDYRKILISPKTNYMLKYEPNASYSRYGISINESTGDFVMYDDANTQCGNRNKITSFDVLLTTLNVLEGINKTYHDHIDGCTKYLSNGDFTYFHINDFNKICKTMNLHENFFNTLTGERHNLPKGDVYICLCNNYITKSFFFIILNDGFPFIYYPYTREQRAELDDTDIHSYMILSANISKQLVKNYAFVSNGDLWSGIKLENGKISMDDIIHNKKFIKKVDNWLIFDCRKSYLVVNINNESKYSLPIFYGDASILKLQNPVYWYISKETISPIYSDRKSMAQNTNLLDYQKKVCKELFKKNSGIDKSTSMALPYTMNRSKEADKSTQSTTNVSQTTLASTNIASTNVKQEPFITKFKKFFKRAK